MNFVVTLQSLKIMHLIYIKDFFKNHYQKLFKVKFIS